MRRTVFLMIPVFLLVCAGTLFALKVPSRGKVYNCSALNIRNGPSTSFQSIGLLSPGTVVEILERSGSWFKVNTGQYQGKFVYSGYIDVTDYEEVDEDQAAQRPHATLNQTDPNRPETRNIDPRVVPLNAD